MHDYTGTVESLRALERAVWMEVHRRPQPMVAEGAAMQGQAWNGEMKIDASARYRRMDLGGASQGVRRRLQRPEAMNGATRADGCVQGPREEVGCDCAAPMISSLRMLLGVEKAVAQTLGRMVANAPVKE